MLVGAGNAYVAEAKRQLFGRVGIDLLAGPTEMLVIADATADPELVAADLLGQAEHGPTSPAVLVTTSAELGAAALAEVERLLARWPTAEVAGAGLARPRRDRRGRGTATEAVALANGAPPSTSRSTPRDDGSTRSSTACATTARSSSASRRPSPTATRRSARTTCCPTAGAARYTGGLWVGKFLKTLTYQWLTAEGTRQVAPAAAAISDAEGFAGHALTAAHAARARWASDERRWTGRRRW